MHPKKNLRIENIDFKFVSKNRAFPTCSPNPLKLAFAQRVALSIVGVTSKQVSALSLRGLK
jgi:hypothetical protein